MSEITVQVVDQWLGQLYLVFFRDGVAEAVSRDTHDLGKRGGLNELWHRSTGEPSNMVTRIIVQARMALRTQGMNTHGETITDGTKSGHDGSDG